MEKENCNKGKYPRNPTICHMLIREIFKTSGVSGQH